MSKQRTKLGARVLSDNELNLILPNANSIYGQIEVFRSAIPTSTENQYMPDQKTNNIGIMGCRGAGKTSILRTFRKRLEENNSHNDIILPIVVPENMSNGTTLMDVVLGMLRPIVEEKKKKDRKETSSDCIYTGRSQLEQSYNELVKQYCYIKKDYRDILIQQFTTEQYYVDKTKEIFNSDTEFIKQFNKFVQILLKQNGPDTSNAMMILFIDDIDLSTTKCMDVVKTLLSYLSNPYIVTFISGDMETFEEALTLEFLRQEEALNGSVFCKTYYSTTEDGDKSILLERKKLLAYEYLRKIIPPAYRKAIKYWSLEERGHYKVSDDAEAGQKNFMELLMAGKNETWKQSYFSYIENGERKSLNASFHMFDFTSRALNNVYNVLQDLHTLLEEQTESADNEKRILEYWRLIETIVDAKPLYAKYKNELFHQIIVLERDQVRVNFENAYQLLYGNQNQAKMDPTERFSIFLLTDFAARVFQQEIEQAPKYTDLKNEIVKEYLCDERIDEKIASKKEKIIFPEDKNKTTVKYILSCLLLQGEFILNLQLIRCLGREAIYEILSEDKDWNNISEQEKAYKVASAFAKAVNAMYETEDSQKESIAALCEKMPQCMNALLNKLSLNPDVVYGRQLLKLVSIHVHGKTSLTEAGQLTAINFWNIENLIAQLEHNKAFYLLAKKEHESFLYWMFYEKFFAERKDAVNLGEMIEYLVSSSVAKAVMQRMHSVMDHYQVVELGRGNYRFLSENVGKENDYLEMKVIMQIDEKKLWDHPYATDIVLPYLKRKISSIKEKMTRGRLVFDASSILKPEGGYSKLKNCDKGVSGKALICNFCENIPSYLFLPSSDRNQFQDGNYYMSLDHVLVVQCLLRQFIRNHPQIRYGRTEVNQLLMEMKELPLVIRTPEWDAIINEVQSREKKFFDNYQRDLEHRFTLQLEEIEVAVNEILERYYHHGNPKTSIDTLLEEYADEQDIQYDKEGSYYFKYLLQEKRIEELKNRMEITETDWSNLEEILSEDKCRFFFHSYFRYLQANDSDAAKAGTEAEIIATFAKHLIESDAIAERKRQSDIYESVSKELDITEEVFEKLFT